MPYEPLHHKYRPQTFADLVGQETIALTLSNALKQARIAPAYLFTGPRGTGKTSSARILAKSLNCLASNQPTPDPCGKCEACLAIAKGSALDVMEIDAASNTGVDNIREIIERSRFAPVQCRYKIYAIDECLSGESLIQTNQGFMRIDNPNLKGKNVLSYNESKEMWEYKKVLRWLERGTKKTLTITTGNSQIRCTANHLIRTETGWIKAENVKEGMKILSPVSVDVALPYINMALMEENEDLQQDISLEGITTAASLITSVKFFSKQKQSDPSVNADAKKSLIFPTFFSKKEKGLKVSNLTGTDIRIKKVMESGISEEKISSTPFKNCKQNNSDSFTELYLGMEASNILTHTVDFLDYVGHMEQNSKNGWNIKQNAYNHCVHNYKVSLIEDMAKNQLSAIQLAILSYEKFMKLLSRVLEVNQFQRNGFNLLHQRDLPGGTWMTALSSLVHKVAPQSFSILRDFVKRRIKLLPNGLQIWDIPQVQNLTLENLHRKLITTSKWEQDPVENGCPIYNNIQSLQWTTNLEQVESVSHAASCEKVYDLEVEDNHNFVANGLLVHNCHMLSTAAFNALLKTLEEPPPQVVFILATTDPQRVLSTIISRCQRFDYRRIPLIEMTAHLKYIANQEKIAIADDALTLISQIANGGLRDAESLLDQLSLLPETITVEKVWDLVGAVPEQDLLKLLQAINQNDSLAVLEQCRSLLDRGREPLVVLQNLASFYLNLLIAKTAPQRPEMTAVTETCWQQLCTAASSWDTSSILRGQQHLKEAESQLKHTTQPRLWLEVTLLGLLPQVRTAIAESTVTAVNPAPIRNSVPSVVNSPQPLLQAKETSKEMVTINHSSPATSIAQVPLAAPKPEVQSLKSGNEDHIKQQNGTASQVSMTKAITTEFPTAKNSASVVEPVIPQTQIQDPVQNQEIWSKVIDCIQFKITKYLLEQHCHLVNFDGFSAIVGISSKSLEKLHQDKVPKIEAAFAQVCQRKVRVKLEFANANHNSTNNAIASSQTTVEVAPPKAETTPAAKVIHPKVAPLTTSNEPIKPETAPVQKQITKSFTPPQNQTNPVETNPKLEHKQPQVIAKPDTSDLPTNAIAPEKPEVTSPTIAEPNSSPDYGDDELQKAIDNLTQSFEGELVQMDNIQEKFVEDPEILEVPEINQDHHGRPNIEDYEDDW